MNCPQCNFPDSKVLDTRSSGDGIRRRRQCQQCETRFTTFERIERKLPAVVKKDGRREPFSRDKVLGGLQLACRKRSVPAEAVEAAMARVEDQLAGSGAEVRSVQIGRLVLAELRELDMVAYVRFASVYQEISSRAEFLALLEPWAEGP